MNARKNANKVKLRDNYIPTRSCSILYETKSVKMVGAFPMKMKKCTS